MLIDWRRFIHWRKWFIFPEGMIIRISRKAKQHFGRRENEFNKVSFRRYNKT